MWLIAIDPGYSKRGQGCACALFGCGLLHHAWFARPDDVSEVMPDGADVVWELPEVRPREDVSPGKANTLIKLAAEGATLAGMYAPATGGKVLAVAPSHWKGSTPKPVHHGRVWLRLSTEERSVIGVPWEIEAKINEAKRLGGLDRWAKPGHTYYRSWPTHNLLDAVGLGQWYLGGQA